MNTRERKLFLIVIAYGVALATVATLLWSLRSFGLPTFRFLDGLKPRARDTKAVYYSFEDDFNYVCAEADAELTALGGWECIAADSLHRTYEFRRGSSADYVIIARINAGHVYVTITTERDSTAFNFRKWWQDLLYGW